MARFTLPSTSILIKVALVVFVLGVGAGVGMSSYLVFTEVREINDLITEDRERLARLEAAPTVTPQPTSTAQPTTTPSSEPTPQPTTTPQPTATSITLQPFPTPQPTATPITLPPTATPQPTATPIALPPTATPQPTATPISLPPTVTPISLPPTPTPAPSWNDLYTRVRRSVVKVETNAGGVGTAWVYEEGWLITAAHVTDGSGPLRVRYRDAEGQERSKIVSVVGVDRLRDVAVLAMEGVDLPAITGRREVGVSDGGEAVMSVGYSSGPEVGWPSVRVGALTTVAEFPWLEGLTAIETDAVFSPGDSGGPIFDINGNVLGIAQVIIYRPGLGRLGRQMGVAISEVEAVWEDLKEGKRLNDNSASWFHRRSG